MPVPRSRRYGAMGEKPRDARVRRRVERSGVEGGRGRDDADRPVGEGGERDLDQPAVVLILGRARDEHEGRGSGEGASGARAGGCHTVAHKRPGAPAPRAP